MAAVKLKSAWLSQAVANRAWRLAMACVNARPISVVCGSVLKEIWYSCNLAIAVKYTYFFSLKKWRYERRAVRRIVAGALRHRYGGWRELVAAS
jgi:hypothetical protein